MKSYSVFLIFITMVACGASNKGNNGGGLSGEENKESIDTLPNNFITSNGIVINTVKKTPDEWKKELSKQEYYVLRGKGTERAFTGDLLNEKSAGIYTCGACGMPLFDSKTKYKSGSGWPSYYQPIDTAFILEDTDFVIGYARTEVMCQRCGGHLGHVFEDGPEPTGLRYCINSVSLDFVENKTTTEIIKQINLKN